MYTTAVYSRDVEAQLFAGRCKAPVSVPAELITSGEQGNSAPVLVGPLTYILRTPRDSQTPVILISINMTKSWLALMVDHLEKQHVKGYASPLNFKRLQQFTSKSIMPMQAVQCCSQRGMACSPMQQMEEQTATDNIHLTPQAILQYPLAACHLQAWILPTMTHRLKDG